MASVRLMFALGLLLHVVKVETMQIKAHVTISGDKVKVESLPDALNVTVRMESNNDTVQLRMRRTPHFEKEITGYCLSTGSSDKNALRRQALVLRDIVGYFHDPTHNAIIQVTPSKDTREGTNRLELKGNFNYAGTRYLLQNARTEERATTSTPPAQFSEQTSKSLNASSTSEKLERLSLKSQVYFLVDHRNMAYNNYDYEEAPSIFDSITNIKTATAEARLESPTKRDRLQIFPRHRRSSKTTYYIDVVAVIDYKAFSRFRTEDVTLDEALANAIKHYTLLFLEVDLIYESISTPDFSIKIKLIKILVSKDESDLLFIKELRQFSTPQNYVDKSKLLQGFRNYVIFEGRDVVGPHDHLILFTGYDLARIDGGRVNASFKGYAYIATMCYSNDKSLSVIRDEGLLSVTTVAHEMGHSLGALHDGDYNSCSMSDRFLMTTTQAHLSEQQNFWTFSNCSIDYITDYTNYLLGTARGRECLLKTFTAEDHKQEMEDVLPGRLYSVDEQCQMFIGVGSKLIWTKTMVKNTSSICTRMYCTDADRPDYCYLRYALSGTTCDDGKMCLSGRCTSHPDAPRVSENCVFGDNPGLVLNGKTCSETVSRFPSVCYSDAVRKLCCSSCLAVRKPVPGCEYGDRISKICKDIKSCARLHTLCCDTCSTEGEDEIS